MMMPSVMPPSVRPDGVSWCPPASTATSKVDVVTSHQWCHKDDAISDVTVMMPSVMSSSVRRSSVCWCQPVTSSVTWHQSNVISDVTKMMLSVTSPSVGSGNVWWCQPASTATSKWGSSDISSDVTKYLWEMLTPPVMSLSTQNHLPQWCCSSHILSVSLPASSVQSKCRCSDLIISWHQHWHHLQWPCLRSDHLSLQLCQVWWRCIILVIMYIYHALVNALSSHMI